jgi:ATP citrate (pro-S)-lyase
VQGMLDFDFICKRKQPSVAGIIYTFGGQFVSKMCVPSFLLHTAQEHG